MDMQKEMADMQSDEPMQEGHEPAKEQAAKDTFFLPSDFPNAGDLKVGDSVSLKVVALSDDGEVEVALGGDKGAEPSLADDLRETLTEKE